MSSCLSFGEQAPSWRRIVTKRKIKMAVKYPKEKTFPIASIPINRHVRLITIFEGSLTILAGVFKDGWVTTDLGGRYPVEAFHEWAPLGRHQRNYSMRIQAHT